MSRPVPAATLDKAIARLAEGATLTQVAKELGHDRSVLSKRLRDNPDIEARYDQAVKEGIEANLEIAFSQATEAKDNFEVQKARLIADNAKWNAAKRYASVYGDKIDTGMVEGLNIILGITRKAIPDKTVVSEQ